MSQLKQSSEIKSTVYLVGAGPGDPKLLTIKAKEILESADVVLYDSLVSSSILNMSNPKALLFPVGKRCGNSKTTP